MRSGLYQQVNQVLHGGSTSRFTSPDSINRNVYVIPKVDVLTILNICH